MPNMQLNDMVDIDQQWMGAEEPEGFIPIPDGRYQAMIEVARAEYTNKTNQRCLYWELVVIGGPEDGKRIFRRNMLETPQNIGWLKADLRKCGIDIDSPAFTPSRFLLEGTGALIGLVMDVSLKTGKPNDQGQTYQNCNFNQVLGGADQQVQTQQLPIQQPPAAGGKQQRPPVAAQPGRMPGNANAQGAPTGQTATPWR